MESIVVVGASLAGVRAAEALRREGYTASLTLVGRETYFPPYDRPPLSKELLSGEWGPDRGRLRIEEGFDATLRLGVSATSLAPDDDVVTLSDGSEIAFDGLVIATGGSPRVLRGIDPDLGGVHLLRTFDDCVALRAGLERATRVAVIGAGFIGAEVASVCRALGREVTVFEPMRFPMERALGPEMGAWAADLQRAHGVDLRLETAVAGLAGERQVDAVLLSGGNASATDLVVVAVGVSPDTSWLEGSGLVLDDGVVCDEALRAIGRENVVAIGDVARWPNPMFGRTMRIEHWANAVEQASAAARTLLADPGAFEPFSSVPYFWSNQFGQKLQYVGVGGTFAGTVHGDLAEERFVAAFEGDGRFVGALCVNSPVKMGACRRLIAAGTAIDNLAGGLR